MDSENMNNQSAAPAATEIPSSPPVADSNTSPDKKKKKKKKSKKGRQKSLSGSADVAAQPSSLTGAFSSPIMGDGVRQSSGSLHANAVAGAPSAGLLGAELWASTANGITHPPLPRTPEETTPRFNPRMADRLTQLQDCLDQLAQQMYLAIHYVSSHHSSSAIEGQPEPPEPSAPSSDPAPGATPGPSEKNPATPNDTTQQTEGSDGPRPDTPTTFARALRELSRDLVLKEQQVETIINHLPGIGSSKDEQERRLKELEGELKGLDEEVKEARKERAELLRVVEDALLKVTRA